MPARGRGGASRPSASEVSARRQVLVEHRGGWYLRAPSADTADKVQVELPAGGQPGGARREWIPKASTRVRAFGSGAIWKAVDLEAGEYEPLVTKVSGTPPPQAGGIFKGAAVAVLRQEKRLMSTGEVTRIALARGLFQCNGKTPEATMASALYTDVKRKEDKSLFTRPEEGLFGLREWETGECFQQPAAGPVPQPQKKKQRTPPKKPKGKRKAAPAAEAAAPAPAAPAAAAPGGPAKGGKKAPAKVKAEKKEAKAAKPVKKKEAKAAPSKEGAPGEAGSGSLGKRPTDTREESILLLLSAADELDRKSDEQEPSVQAPASKRHKSETSSPVSKFRPAGGSEVPSTSAPGTPAPTAGTPAAPNQPGALILNKSPLLSNHNLKSASDLLIHPAGKSSQGTVGPVGGVPGTGLLHLIEQQIIQLERQLGIFNPHVGKAWLDLTKLYHQEGLFDQAEAALTRSYVIFQRCQEASPTSDVCTQAFGSLLATFHAARQQTTSPSGSTKQTQDVAPIACLSPVAKGLNPGVQVAAT